MTVSGNIFSGSSYGVFTTANTYISNNTFIACTTAVNNFAGTLVVDNNIFVGYSSNSFLDLNAGTSSNIVTNNRFVGPSGNGIFGSFPNYLAYNDFIDSGLYLLFGGNWNVNSTYVLNNYVGDDGAWETLNYQLTGNTKITSFYVSFTGSTRFPVASTPNHQDLPNGHWLQNVDWKIAGSTKPYFVVGDQVTLSWKYQQPSWYDKFNIPTSSLPTTIYSSVYHGPNDNNHKGWGTVTPHFGDQSYVYTIKSTDLTGSSSVPYYLCIAVGESCFTPNTTKYIFSHEPVSFSLSDMAINGIYYTDQTDITASIFTDASISNITFSLVNTVHPQSYPFLFYANGTGLNENITLPVHSATNNVQDWELQVTFTLPDGTQYEKSAPLSVYISPPSSCYHLSITVDKGLKQTNPIQRFTLQDLGCNTTDWQIASVNNSLWYEYDNHEVVLNISAALSGGRPVHYQITDTVVGKLVHNVATNITIVNHNPVINSATFTWTYPRTKTVFPAWNLLSNCTDQDGDSLSVVQIQRTKTRTADSVQQLDPYTLLFVPEKAMVQVKPTGEITLTSPSSNNQSPVTAGPPLALFWNKDLSFQFEITDGDIDNANVWGTASINSV
eukprot:TRINITY_DN25_c0_g1_i3.p1 TRINITY_DN25_c0_g1~~TRINITY_DN25_c0_g1_i3.p1  ORF type:complete len:633 (-),score=146.29 TRINITY_DN25_c0_g1_i3:78-1910(-)